MTKFTRRSRRRGILGLAAVTLIALGAAGSCDRPETSSLAATTDVGSFAGRVTRIVDGDTFWLDSRDVSIRVGVWTHRSADSQVAPRRPQLTQMIAGERLTCRERDGAATAGSSANVSWKAALAQPRLGCLR